jgi:ubiquinone/menaquinone biosynthesis C-methylase UbiE
MESDMDTKAREFESWRSVVPGWRKHDQRLTSAFGAVSEELLDRAGIQDGHHVLDVASGTGEPAIPAARRVGPQGRVTATDFVAEMIAFAKEKADASGLANIEFLLVDGEALDLSPATFDAATMRWGLMFMPDPATCLGRIYDALKPDARFATACWTGPEENPWASVPLGILRNYMEIPQPQPAQTGIFSFADPDRIKKLMAAAGFKNISVEPMDVLWSGPESGAMYFQEVIEMAGPLAALYAQLTSDERAAYANDVAEQAERLSVKKPGIAFPGRTWIAAGNR